MLESIRELKVCLHLPAIIEVTALLYTLFSVQSSVSCFAAMDSKIIDKKKWANDTDQMTWLNVPNRFLEELLLLTEISSSIEIMPWISN